MSRLFNLVLFLVFNLLIASLSFGGDDKQAIKSLSCTEFKSQEDCSKVMKIFFEVESKGLAPAVQTNGEANLEDIKIQNSVGLCEVDPSNEICKKIKEKK